jgi:S-adenosylmethionine hydrolase
MGRFPDGTVHVAVVDPGVGTPRKLLAACGARCYWIGPDNGVLSAVLALPDCEIRAIDPDALGLTAESRTFHGRDLFAPAAGLVSGGRYGFRALGARTADVHRLSPNESPRVLFVDRFGNLITNVPADRVRGPVVRIARRDIEVKGTYGEVPSGQPLALINSYGTLEIAVAQGSAYELLGVGRGEPVLLPD